jgi:NTP pyrophosphatase (non-canonical NTP hydrolase)
MILMKNMETKRIMNKFAVNRLETEQQEEIMLIAQEECAEVTQAISKVFRFGIDGKHNGITNKQHLEEEIGDLVCMLDLMRDHGLIDWGNVIDASSKKLIKLQAWSNIK